jgi:hypothetical protein
MKTLINFISILVLGLAAGSFVAPGPADAQAVKPARATAKAVTPDGRLSPEIQRALESDKPETAAALLVPAVQKARAATSSPAAPSDLKLAAPGGGLGYTCNGGNCACAGASDCVTMISTDGKCVEDTVGCNDYGCTCKEN